MARKRKPPLDANLTIRVDPETDEKLRALARELGMTRAALVRKLLFELGVPELEYYGSSKALKRAWSTLEGARHVARVIRGLEPPRRLQ